MKNDTCLLCLEDLILTEKLVKPSQCNCQVILHHNCIQLIENTGLLCPICRIKKLPIKRVPINISNNDLFLSLFANKVFSYLMTKPNLYRFIIFFAACCCITTEIILRLLWMILSEKMRFMISLVFISMISFLSVKKFISSLY